MDCEGDGDLSSILLTRGRGRSDHNNSANPSPFFLPDSDHHDSTFDIMIMLMQAQDRTPQRNVNDLPNVMGTRHHARSPCCMQELGTGKSHSLLNKAQLAAATSPKRRKALQKRTVCVSAVGSNSSSSSSSAGSRGSMGESYLPRDMWAWRKYGQKPIKGSPHPRGYYKCSSSKGCPARKQVERSQTEPNMLLITYTSEHNHPFPTHRNALAGSTRPNLHALSNSTATIALAEEENQLIQAEANTREVQISPSPNSENSEEKVVLESSLAAVGENYEESKELLLHRYLLSELQDHLDDEGIMAICSSHIGSASLIERVDYEEDEADLLMEESAPLDPFYNLFEWSSSPLS